jgi:hypothetical protein
METSLESLLSRLETAYYNAKSSYQNANMADYESAQAQRQAIKDEIVARFSRIENELRGYQNGKI